LCKVLFATETFAVGINMPTKTVIFTALSKFTDGGERLLKSAEYIQMAGRAGRRGKDDRGLVLYLPQRDPVDLLEMKQIICGKVSSFSSRMSFRYDFILKLLNSAASSAPATAAATATQGSKRITEKEMIQKSYWHALQQEYLDGLKKELSCISTSLLEHAITPEELQECQAFIPFNRRFLRARMRRRRPLRGN
jgi:superfamily II RNA helicase